MNEDKDYEEDDSAVEVPLDEQAETVEGQNWLDRMHDLLEWRVLTPRPWVPYGKTLSEAALEELSVNKEILLRHVKLRGLCGGDQLILLAGLDTKTARTLVIESDHPTIGSLSKSDIFSYLHRRGIFSVIDQEMEAVQKSYKEELARRKASRKHKKRIKA